MIKEELVDDKLNHRYPYLTLFKKYIRNLGRADENGWAIGDCPFCGEPGTFQVNLKTGRWVCFPTPDKGNSQLPRQLMN
jgi:hypothetical protein